MNLILAVVLLATARAMAVSATRSGSNGGWRSLRWFASAAAFAGALAAAPALLA